jgi:hypothetical protein
MLSREENLSGLKSVKTGIACGYSMMRVKTVRGNGAKAELAAVTL